MLIFAHDQMSFAAFYAAMKTGAGLTEFAIGTVCLSVGGWLSRLSLRRWFAPHPEHLEQFWPYVGLRLVLPVAAQGLLVLSAMVWVLALGHKPHVLVAFAAMLFWMAAIRMFTAMIREALPRGRIGRTTESFVSAMLWLAFMTWVIGLDGIALGWMHSVSFTVGKTQFDLAMVLSAMLWAGAIMIAALWFSRLIEKRVMRLERIDLNLRLVIVKLSRTVLVVVAVLTSLPIVGIDLTVLSFFGGALGVGLGFGMQKIASNYVSGFIILLERSIRIGDRLMVDGRVGYVTRITTRFVVLKCLDGTDALVPNDVMVSNTVVNQSYSDRQMWSCVSIDVAFGTDLELALKLMVQAASQPRILPSPAPTACITLFGPNGISLQVGFWVPDPENGFLQLHSDIYLAIWRLFSENQIKVPLPQSGMTVLNASALDPGTARMPLQTAESAEGAATGVSTGASMGDASCLAFFPPDSQTHSSTASQAVPTQRAV